MQSYGRDLSHNDRWILFTQVRFHWLSLKLCHIFIVYFQCLFHCLSRSMFYFFDCNSDKSQFSPNRIFSFFYFNFDFSFFPSIGCVVVGLLWFVWGARALRNLQEIDVSSIFNFLWFSFKYLSTGERVESGEERGREGGEEVGEVQIFLLLLNLLSEKIGTFDKSEKFKYFYSSGLFPRSFSCSRAAASWKKFEFGDFSPSQIFPVMVQKQPSTIPSIP